MIFYFFTNFIALLVATYFIKEFEVVPDLASFSLVAGVFTLINVFIRPILKLILSPVIILTFGLGIILVNALTLYLLDIVLTDITITGLTTLIYATLIISLINILISFSAKKYIKNDYFNRANYYFGYFDYFGFASREIFRAFRCFWQRWKRILQPAARF